MKDWMDTSFEITNLSRFLQNENISTEFVNKTIDGQFTQKVCRILLHFTKSQIAYVIGAYQNMENLAGKSYHYAQLMHLFTFQKKFNLTNFLG